MEKISTIQIDEITRIELNILKYELGKKTISETIKHLIEVSRKKCKHN